MSTTCHCTFSPGQEKGTKVRGPHGQRWGTLNDVEAHRRADSGGLKKRKLFHSNVVSFHLVSVRKERAVLCGRTRRSETLHPKSQDTKDISARIWSKSDRAVIVVPRGPSSTRMTKNFEEGLRENIRIIIYKCSSFEDWRRKSYFPFILTWWLISSVFAAPQTHSLLYSSWVIASVCLKGFHLILSNSK